MTSASSADLDLQFPDSNGKPMADNTEQYRWIVIIKENLEILFSDCPDVFIAGDLLWYPIRSRLIAPVAPDVMVAFGRPKGRRGSYKQWQEDNIPPQVVFEIRSPSNDAEETDRKLEFYDTYGVEEYYLYNPDNFQLDAWVRQGQHLAKVWQLDQWMSPRLGIRFEIGQGELELYRPDGQRFLTSVEMEQRIRETETALQQERQRANQERQRAEQLEDYLRSLGVDPSQLP
jgi:Uma2 family endonuclease